MDADQAGQRLKMKVKIGEEKKCSPSKMMMRHTAKGMDDREDQAVK